MRDESYAAGYRAGHLQGWIDAVAKLQSAGQPSPPVTESLSSDAADARLGEGTTAAAQQCANAGAPETPAQRQARREKRDRQNINITLYVASLLLVAAAALFIGTSFPPLLRFAGVCAVTALFYGPGFALHARVPRLKPGTVAFTGSGLALMPVTGLAL